MLRVEEVPEGWLPREEVWRWGCLLRVQWSDRRAYRGIRETQNRSRYDRDSLDHLRWTLTNRRIPVSQRRYLFQLSNWFFEVSENLSLRVIFSLAVRDFGAALCMKFLKFEENLPEQLRDRPWINLEGEKAFLHKKGADPNYSVCHTNRRKPFSGRLPFSVGVRPHQRGLAVLWVEKLRSSAFERCIVSSIC